MEPVGANLEGEWSSLRGMYTNEEADFMAELLGNSFHSSLSLPAFCYGNESGMSMDSGVSGHSSDMVCKLSQGRCFSSSASQGTYYWSDSNLALLDNNISMLMDLYVGDVTKTASCLVEGDDGCNLESTRGNPDEESAFPDNNLQPEKEEDMAMQELLAEYKSNSPTEVSKKRPPNAENVSSKNSERNIRSRKNQKLDSNEDDESNSEDNSNPCQEFNGGSSSSLSSKGNSALSLNGKTRASRGAASDPQSIYARKRRERINERLRILQNLVPNGTKVDISTMLEEAVRYVKFLQLQIKLLSSDDLWMHAPIAYNGMDVGLDKFTNYTSMLVEVKRRE